MINRGGCMISQKVHPAKGDEAILVYFLFKKAA